MLIDEGLELLDESEALRSLAAGEIGRVGVTIGALPAIFPVNYRLIDGCIIFRIVAGLETSAAARGAVVAFEVDDYNVSDRSGWSVMVVGIFGDRPRSGCHVQDTRGGVGAVRRRTRGAIVRIVPTFVSGRRIVHLATGPVGPIEKCDDVAQ